MGDGYQGEDTIDLTTLPATDETTDDDSLQDSGDDAGEGEPETDGTDGQGDEPDATEALEDPEPEESIESLREYRTKAEQRLRDKDRYISELQGKAAPPPPPAPPPQPPPPPFMGDPRMLPGWEKLNPQQQGMMYQRLEEHRLQYAIDSRVAAQLNAKEKQQVWNQAASDVTSFFNEHNLKGEQQDRMIETLRDKFGLDITHANPEDVMRFKNLRQTLETARQAAFGGAAKLPAKKPGTGLRPSAGKKTPAPKPSASSKFLYTSNDAADEILAEIRAGKIK